MARFIARTFWQLYLAQGAEQVDCWKITRTDGQVVRITNHDQPLWIFSEEYKPSVPETFGDPLAYGGGGDGYSHSARSGLADSSSAVEGLVSSDEITTSDLLSGLYDDATIEHRIVDARLPEAGEFLRVYKIAQIAIDSRGTWRAELMGRVPAVLSERRGDTVTEDCRNQLFDAQCSRAKTIGGSDGLVRSEWQVGYAPGAYCTVSQVTSDRQFRVAMPTASISAIDVTTTGDGETFFQTTSPHYFSADPAVADTPIRTPIHIFGQDGWSPDMNGTWASARVAPFGSPDVGIVVSGVDATATGGARGSVCLAPVENQFRRGLITWRSGENAPSIAVVESSSAFVSDPAYGGYVDVTLEMPPRFDIDVGDTLTLETGCDGTAETCVQRFANLVNFRGEPTVSNAYDTLQTPELL